MRDMCPHCGYNFERDDAIHDGRWVLNATHATYRGKQVQISPQEASALYSIAKGEGVLVSYEAVLNRITSSEALNHAHVVVCRLKRKLPVVPFDVVRGLGLKWTGGKK